MNKKLLVLLGVVVIGGVAYYLSGSGLFQGRLTFVNENQLSSLMDGLCLTPGEFKKKYGNPPSKDISEISDESRGEDEGEIVVKIDGGSGRGTNVLGGGAGEGTDSEKDSGTDKVKINDDYSGSKNNPMLGYSSECSCRQVGNVIKEYQEEGGNYVKLICSFPDTVCVPPKFLCPDGTEIDKTALNKQCKKLKAKQCFQAKLPDQEQMGMCKLLAPYVFEYKCVDPFECEKYLKMTPDEELKWFDALDLPNEAKNAGKGADKYQPKNNSEQAALDAFKMNSDCNELYKENGQSIYE